MPPSTPRLLLLDGRAPEGRSGRAVGDWFAERARQHPGFVLDVAVVSQLELPMWPTTADEPTIAAWSARVAAADAVVVLTPEYNASFPAWVKQAIDLLRSEWADTVIGFVTYGGISGGLRAADQLRPVFAELRAVTVRDTVSFARPWERLDDGGTLDAGGEAEAAADILLDDLERWARLLGDARTYGTRAA